MITRLGTHVRSGHSRRLRVYAQPAAGLPQRWMATGGQLLKVALLGQQTHALRGIEQIGPRESWAIWTEWFRLKNYIVAVGMAGGRGVRFPSALRQLAQAACAKARAALFWQCHADTSSRTSGQPADLGAAQRTSRSPVLLRPAHTSYVPKEKYMHNSSVSAVSCYSPAARKCRPNARRPK